MKRVLLTAIGGLLLAATSHAQLSKGQKMLGGELSFTSSENKNEFFLGEVNETSATITPQIGFGLSKNWIAGAGLGYTHLNQKSGSFKFTLNIFTAGVYLRKFHPFGDKAGVFGQLDLAAGFGKGKETQGGGFPVEEKTDVTTIAGIVSPGFYYKISKRIILETKFGGLGYSTMTSKAEGGEKVNQNEFSFRLTSTLGLGFQVQL